MIMIDNQGKWKKMIGAECTYAIKYKGESIFAAQKCKKSL